MSWKTHNFDLFVEMTLENTENMDEMQVTRFLRDVLLMSVHSRLVSAVCMCVFVCMETQITNVGDLGEILLFTAAPFSSTLL